MEVGKDDKRKFAQIFLEESFLVSSLPASIAVHDVNGLPVAYNDDFYAKGPERRPLL